MTRLNFLVDQELCIACEACISDCPVLVLAMDDGFPVVIAGRESMCISCLHCLTVCPVAAVSIHGFTPGECLELETALPTADMVETLIRGRRSVRHYQDENVDPEVMERLLQVAWQAPTGVNARKVLFTVVDDRETMNRLRKTVMGRLAELVHNDELPEALELFAGFVKAWEEKGIDTLFRGAPHLIITSAPQDCPCPEQDCTIALAYFELFACSLGLGTVWDGLAKRIFVDLMPDLATVLGVPDDHYFGYVMAFGKPAVVYPRTVPLRAPPLNRVSLP